ncbi:MAG: hypothetical protein IIB31_01330 [Chloroflexi bacterium]|nr:hypothetical protein [Chloroflexota bacterium]
MSIYAIFYELLPLASFIFNIFLLSLVLRSDWRNLRNRVFALLLFTMALWGLTIFGVRTSPHPDGADLAMIWERTAVVMVLGISVLFYHFSVLYTRIRVPKANLATFYTAWVIFAVLSVTGHVVDRVEEVTLLGGYVGWTYRFTMLGILYLALGYVPVVLGIANLVQRHRVSKSPEEKNRILYMVVGAGLSLVGATSDFLFSSGIFFYPFGIMANLYFVALTSVAMLKYQLLELRVVLRSGLTYTLLGTFIVGVYGVVFVLFNFTFRSQSEPARLLAVISAAAVVAIALQPVLSQLQRWADHWFSRERYDHLQALVQFSQDTKDITDLKSIADSLTGLVSQAMLASSSALLLPAPQSTGRPKAPGLPQSPGFYVASTDELSGAEGIILGDESPILNWLRDNNGILTRQDLEVVTKFRALTVDEQRAVELLDMELLIPLQSKGELTGVLVVGPKLADEDYSTSDINLLRTVVNQTATAIENARLYGQESERLAELEALEKMKQTLLLTVAHELKTPLTAIKAGTEMLGLQEDVPASGAKGRLIRSINRGVERLERLVDESLDYAQMQDSNLQLDLESTDLRELYQETVSLLSPVARSKRQSLELNLPDKLPLLQIDRRRCERILLNLISNANRYTDFGGEITVGVSLERDYLITHVTDNGQGVAEEDLEKVFNVYYRNASADGLGAGKSSGIGLAIAKYLVELHGGRIWVESTLGEGSTFYFSLPLGDDHESIGN